MKVICTENRTKHGMFDLVIGKEYECVEIKKIEPDNPRSHYYTIINGNRRRTKCDYPAWCFIFKEELRDKKLGELGI